MLSQIFEVKSIQFKFLRQLFFNPFIIDSSVLESSMEYLLERSKVQGAFLLGTLRNNNDQNYYWGSQLQNSDLKYIYHSRKKVPPLVKASQEVL